MFDVPNPPKSPENIRASLESIHDSAKMKSHEGPFANGLSDDYPITIATFFETRIASSLQRFLSQSGMFSKVVPTQYGAAVVVDKEDRELAWQLYRENQEQFPNHIPKKESKRYDCLIFGTAIGMSIGLIIVIDIYSKPQAAAIPITFAALGAVTGHLLDRLRMSRTRTGRARMGIWELLLAMSIPGMMILIARIIRDIFGG